MAIGKSYVLSSGQTLTNSFVYTAKYTVRNFASVGITVEVVDPGSGVEYTVRGYPVEGMPVVRSIASGSVISSGNTAYMSLTDPYDQIELGLKALQTNESGIATVYVTGRRY